MAFTSAGGSPSRDAIENVKLEITCSGGGYIDEYQGTLTPEVATGALVFGSGSGELEDISHNRAAFTGTDKLSAPPGKLTAQY